MQGLSFTEKFTELLSELEDCSEEEQKQKIIEINEMIERMDANELELVCSEEILVSLWIKIEKRKLFLENAFLLLKHLGYCNVLKGTFKNCLDCDSLKYGFEKMIIEEEQKNEGKNEKLLVDLCECYVFMQGLNSQRLHSTCMQCLLKVALNKEENEETQKEVEMALLALSDIYEYCFIEQELYLSEIKEIIQYHQEHHNLTQLASLSAWQFFFRRLCHDNSLVGVIVNELHFAREATRELEELRECIDWKREKKEKRSVEGEKEEFLVVRWIISLNVYLFSCKLLNEELNGILNRIVQEFQAARDNCIEIIMDYFDIFIISIFGGSMEIVDFLKSGAVDLILKEIQRPTMKDEIPSNSLEIFIEMSNRLKEEEDNENEETKREEMKRKVFEKIKEEGYEDVISSFSEIISFLYYYYRMNLL